MKASMTPPPPPPLFCLTGLRVGLASYTSAGISSFRSSASSTSTLNGPPGVSTAYMSYSAIATNRVHVVHSGILVK